MAGILYAADKGTDLSSAIQQRLYIECQYIFRKEDVLILLRDLQDSGFITLTTRPKNPDATFCEYGIKIHERLRLYIECSGKWFFIHIYNI